MSTTPSVGKAVIQPHGDRYLHRQSPRHAPDHGGAGPRGRAALRAGAPPRLRQHGRRARHRGGALLRHPQPGLLWGLQLLLPGLSPGPDHHLPQPRERHPGGHRPDAAPRLQGLHPRRGRPHGQLPPPFLPEAAQARAVQDTGPAWPPTPCPNLDADHTDYLHAAAQAPGHPRRQEGLHPLAASASTI